MARLTNAQKAALQHLVHDRCPVMQLPRGGGIASATNAPCTR